MQGTRTPRISGFRSQELGDIETKETRTKKPWIQGNGKKRIRGLKHEGLEDPADPESHGFFDPEAKDLMIQKSKDPVVQESKNSMIQIPELTMIQESKGLMIQKHGMQGIRTPRI
ncbi:Hypothetical protein NTJ_15214 [Nesidiocoris tenuis]|uniref:Uncharacterized protein n=1 Tax=Nesidiocoris tenuis TaxID=355587 RepID=A0ABN7BHC6_9HEMI|nr:Hypothetical protein NTJ_15214 [Nesidiocoris tenuis]